MLAGVPGSGKVLLPVVVGAPAAMPAAVEQGLTHAKYWLLQAYEQLEKVGPAGSPVGEDGVGDTTPGVTACASAVVVPQSKRRKTSLSLIAYPLSPVMLHDAAVRDLARHRPQP